MSHLKPFGVCPLWQYIWFYIAVVQGYNLHVFLDLFDFEYMCSVTCSWVWSEAGQQMDLESALGIGGFGYPVSRSIEVCFPCKTNIHVPYVLFLHVNVLLCTSTWEVFVSVKTGNQLISLFLLCIVGYGCREYKKTGLCFTKGTI